MNLTFEAILEANRKRQKEWDPTNKITQEFRTIEMGGEAGEVLAAVADIIEVQARALRIGALSGAVLNVSKKLARERMGLRGTIVSKEALGEEIADLILTAFLLADDAGVDPATAVVEKFNKVSRDRDLCTFLIPIDPLEELCLVAPKQSLGQKLRSLVKLEPLLKIDAPRTKTSESWPTGWPTGKPK